MIDTLKPHVFNYKPEEGRMEGWRKKGKKRPFQRSTFMLLMVSGHFFPLFTSVIADPCRVSFYKYFAKKYFTLLFMKSLLLIIHAKTRNTCDI